MARWIVTRLDHALLAQVLACGPLALEVYVLLCEAGAWAEGGVMYSRRSIRDSLERAGRSPSDRTISDAIRSLSDVGIVSAKRSSRTETRYRLVVPVSTTCGTREYHDVVPVDTSAERCGTADNRTCTTGGTTQRPFSSSPSPPPHPLHSSTTTSRRTSPGSSVGRSESLPSRARVVGGSGGDPLAEARSAGDGSAGSTDRPRMDTSRPGEDGRTRLDSDLVADLVARIGQLPGLGGSRYGADQVGDLLEELGLDAIEQGIEFYRRVDRSRWRSAVAALERCCRDPGSMPLASAVAAPPVYAEEEWRSAPKTQADSAPLTAEQRAMLEQFRRTATHEPQAMGSAAPELPCATSDSVGAIAAIAMGVIDELAAVAAPSKRRSKGGRP